MATAPASPARGLTYFDTAQGSLRNYDGSRWTRAGEVFVYKTTPTPLNNTTTLQMDPHLRFDVGANEIWQFEIVVFGEFTWNNDVKYSLAGPTLAWMQAWVWGYDESNNIRESDYFNSFADQDAMDLPSTQNGIIFVKGIASFSAGGTFGFEWAPAGGLFTTATVYRGSYLIARRLD